MNPFDDEAGDRADFEKIQRMLQSGEARMLLVHQEVIMVPASAHRKTRSHSESFKETSSVPHEHQWEFDRTNFKRRFCVKSGCRVSQVFQISPESKTHLGVWIDEPRVKPVYELDDVFKPAPIIKRRKRVKA